MPPRLRTIHATSHLRLVPPLDDGTGVRDPRRLVEAAVVAVCHTFDVRRCAALTALHAASRRTSRPLWVVAAGVLLSHRLPSSLVGRLRRTAPPHPTRPTRATPAHTEARHVAESMQRHPSTIQEFR